MFPRYLKFQNAKSTPANKPPFGIKIASNEIKGVTPHEDSHCPWYQT